jgi:DNA mismatch endonuclease (patch repair protein)
MADLISKSRRSEIMRGIKSKDTAPEKLVRSLLQKHGYRFRLHSKTLPGKPDLRLPKYKAVIFVHGCFWHGHSCRGIKQIPLTHPKFWKDKISTNQRRDTRVISDLLKEGWRVCIIWECALKGRKRISEEKLIHALKKWLGTKSPALDIAGSIFT